MSIQLKRWMVCAFAVAMTWCAQAQFRLVAFNIWGDFFGNPPHERDLVEVELLRSHQPDFIALQEVTPNFWKSRLISELEHDYGIGGRNMSTPILWRKDKFELLGQGGKRFCPELDASKGVAWVAVRDKQSGKAVVAFASHFWWQDKGVADDYVRLTNARDLYATVMAAADKYHAAAVGGGDLNAPLTSSALKELKSKGLADAQETSPKTDPRATWRDFPKRDAQGVYRGVVHEQAQKMEWLDHVFYHPALITPVEFAMDRTQCALDVSDHSPIIFDFELK